MPIVAHELADPEKGTGIAMICTFGDTTDVTWWRELVAAGAGRSSSATAGSARVTWGEPGWETADAAAAQAAYDELAGKTVKQAQARIVELLQRGRRSSTARSGPITHPVKFWENGTRPLEIVTSQQWFIRYPPKDELLARGKELALVARLHAGPLRELGQRPHRRLEHHPPALLRRAVPGLVPDRRRRRRRLALARSWPTRTSLPDRPDHRHAPPGYDEAQRNQPGGFAADPDVMDTWATSSLTPQIVCGWEDDPDLFERTFPMDLRPQAHDIIRTWLFSTVVRSHYEHGVAAVGATPPSPASSSTPTARSCRSRPATCPTTRSRSSTATAPTPCATGRPTAGPGMDIAFDEGQMKIGRRLAIKLLNASKFALGLGSARPAAPSPTPLDRSMLAGLADLVDEATAAFDALRLRPGPRAHRDAASGRSATTTSSW